MEKKIVIIRQIIVASFAEAWIEIKFECNSKLGDMVASFAEAWIEIAVKTADTRIWSRRLLRGGVD